MGDDKADANSLDLVNQSGEWPEESSAKLTTQLRPTQTAEEYFADTNQAITKWKKHYEARDTKKFLEIVGR